MDRRPLVAGNWKMYKTSGEAAVLVQKLEDFAGAAWRSADVVLCPPFVDLKAVSTVLELDEVPMSLGAQNVYWEEEGAFTGEVAPRMLVELGVEYCIVGHSERREYFGESDSDVNKKVHALLKHGITPIMCCGETLETREAGETEPFVRDQVRRGLDGVSEEQAAGIVVAYEPIWAIGTGRTPTPEMANDVARSIRATVGAMFGQPAAIQARILYGGSVKAENAKVFFGEPDIDGALVGGASLDAENFSRIVEAALP